MKPSCQVADKAVSTEDLDRNLVKKGDEGDEEEEDKKKKQVPPNGESTAIEVVRLEALLAALVESKVVAIKAASCSKKSAISSILRPRSQSTTHGLRQQRLTSTSTTGSSHKENDYQSHHHHHYRHCHKRQSDSILFASGLFSKKHQRHNHNHNHRHHHHHHHHHHIVAENSDKDGRAQMKLDQEAGCRLLQKETAFGGSSITLSPPTAGPSSSHQRGSPAHQSCLYSYDERRGNHRIVMSACPSPTNSLQSKILVARCSDAEYIAINMERTQDDDEDTEQHLDALMDAEDVVTGRASLQDAHRKRKRKKRRKRLDAEGRVRRGASGGGLDPEDLPKRARWTIIATACLLLLMSVLLVGVTLRMAPIIDEMVRKETEEMVNAISREEGSERNSTVKGVTVGSSPMPLSL